MNPNNQPTNPGNLFIAVILSMTLLLGFHFFYERPKLEEMRRAQALQQAAKALDKATPDKVLTPETPKDRAALIAASKRITIESPALQGSINLLGARFDDLALPQYRTTLDKVSPPVVLLSPSGSLAPTPGYYADFGWLADAPLSVPQPDTLWEVDGNATLRPGAPVTLHWDNREGLRFERSIALDDNFMFTITDRVRNQNDKPVTIHPYALIMHQTKPDKRDLAFGHTGPMGVFEGVLQEHGYEALEEKLEIPEAATGGWMGISDKYWLTALIPNPTEKYTATFRHAREPNQKAEQGRYQVDFRGQPFTIAPQATQDYTRHFFAGAKRVELLGTYSEQMNIEKFELAIDFGWFRFLTKPMLITLNWLGQKIGNVGLAILVLTILVKLLVLPLGIKSYRSMAKMKILQPEMARLQERFKDDRQRQSIEMMEMYKREKISPLSGCLPLLAQMPVFFALYKVLYIGIDMRHAPFYGWIQDLSAPDPTNLINLFGLLPFTAPAFLHIGAWPILMGISMFFLQKMSPAPTDPIQKSVITWMPVMFTVMLAPTMPAGLIIYWTWSNLISILQQYLIFRRIAKH
ncbi:MAG: membrane protein insertase YidC [Alphaproteobacteria bacterium]|nr:membrane protein insertase YidC [Alphaproteobacteria bacterium]